MSGRRNAGGSAELLTKLVYEDRNKRIENDEKRQEFNQRLQQALAVEDFKAQIQDRRTQQNNANVDQLLQQRQGFQASQQPLSMPGAQPQSQAPQQAQQSSGMPGFDTSDMDYRITIDSSGRKSVVFTPKKAPKEPKYLPEGQAGAMLGQAQPGMPLPHTRQPVNQYGDPIQGREVNNIPQSIAGRNTMNQAIQSGMTESPAAQYQGMLPQGGRFSPVAGGGVVGGDNMEVLPGYERFAQPRSQLLSLLQGQSQAPQVQAPMSQPALLQTPQAQAQPQQSNDPITQRIQQAIQQGVPPEKIANDLRAKGIDPAQYGL